MAETNKEAFLKLITDDDNGETIREIKDRIRNRYKTALEWYIDNLADILGDDVINNLSAEQLNKIQFLSKQAKSMEREQIIIARFTAPLMPSIEKENYAEEAEQYYNETYGKQEKL